MTAAICPRLWEVEAARDGRLERGALATLERHATGCEQCRARRASLEAVAYGLRAASPMLDEVALRRTRLAMLQRAASLLGPRRAQLGSRSRPLIFAAVGAVALASAALLSMRVDLHPAIRHPAQHLLVVATPIGSAAWRRHSAPDAERIDLDEGSLRVAVHRSPSDPRVVVRVPEGEIEDVGTLFEITVRDGHTAKLSVSRGEVVFRRFGRPDLRLQAGAAWTPVADAHDPLEVAVTTPPRTAAHATAAPSAKSSLPRGKTRATAAAVSPERTVPLDQAAETQPPAATPDTAAEDAAYLQVLALLREGRTDEARLAAAGYLRKFPAGFRRPEVEKIAWPAGF
jgi:hypothetical protein